ncbi:MAG: T9SS type A sorting domain-containing protein [Bacteroidetes bacterium]|nr:T9SS type A sorting domain-containing protein [Bacteroidota bacterium]
MKKILFILSIVFSFLIINAQDIHYIEYFVDTDPGFGQATEIENFVPGENINLLLNISQELSPGFHNIGIRSKDAYSWSQTNFSSVLIMQDTVNNPISRIEYFWLNDAGFNDPLCSDTIINDSIVNLEDSKIAVDVPTDLPVGNNSLFMRVQDENGAWSHTQLVGDIHVCSSSFLKYITETAWCSYTSPSGQVFTESGVYRDFVNTPLDCDSSFLINLTINTVDTSIYMSDETLYANNTTAESYQWIDCSNGYSPIPGENDYMFKPIESGNYAVIISNNDCSDTSNCRQVTIGSISELGNSRIILYPNPNSGSFKIKVESANKSYHLYDLHVEIRNFFGTLVFKKELLNDNETEVYLDQPAGIYFLHVNSDKGSSVSKFVVQ